MNLERRLNLRYCLELAGTMVLYLGAIYARKHLQPGNAGPALHAAIDLAPAIPVWMVFWVLLRHYHRLDEYMRIELLQIVAVCAGITACVAASYPFARTTFGWPDFSIEYAWNVMAVCWIAATLIVQFRNRRTIVSC